MKNNRVVVLGVFNADAVFTARRLPHLGETIMGSGFALGPGGKGSNQAVAAARAGGDVHMISCLGRDDFGLMARGLWSNEGITAHLCEDDSRHTGAAFIFLEERSGQNAIIVAPGAGGALSAAHVIAHRAVIAGAKVFLTQLEQPLNTAFEGLKIAREHGVLTILNPAPATTLPDEMLALVDILTPNETEAEALTGVPIHDVASAEKAAQVLLARGVGAVVITMGALGAFYASASETHYIPAKAAGEVRDTTGAGDAFNGALATALAEDRPIKDALYFASLAAGIAVTRAGAASAMPQRAEILANKPC